MNVKASTVTGHRFGVSADAVFAVILSVDSRLSVLLGNHSVPPLSAIWLDDRARSSRERFGPGSAPYLAQGSVPQRAAPGRSERPATAAQRVADVHRIPRPIADPRSPSDIVRWYSWGETNRVRGPPLSPAGSMPRRASPARAFLSGQRARL